MKIKDLKPLFPMIYLTLAALIAISCKYLDVDATSTGMLVGAALTRVKMPAPTLSGEKTPAPTA